MSETVHLLVSPDAGRGRAGGARETVLRELAAADVEVIDITGADADGSRAAAADVVAAGATRVVVVGGDGLVHLAVQAVATSDTALGVVPVGTGNDFARGVDGVGDDDLRASVRAALGPPGPIDAIRTDHGWVASVATAGFSGDVNGRANRLRFPRGPSRYTVATVAELPGLRTHEITVTVDGETFTTPAALLAVANTGWFGGGMHICPDADPADGLLEMTVVADVGRLELLRFFRLVFSGRHLEHPKVHTHRGREIRVDAGDLAFWGDGEPLGRAPTTMTAEPGALLLAGAVGQPRDD
ncbi:MAG: diacylglycerol kinase family protein [Acidimicrobiales bacterium]|nr:diacylglycerol kinase family protein [Acidimicrobiales bacterium]